MTTLPHHKPDSQSTEQVFAFHCSGGSYKQWRPLTQALGDSFNVVTPSNGTCSQIPHTQQAIEFTLADEAARSLELIDNTDGLVHLVGHSFGGAVALYIATQRPEKVASLTLYEPAAFHVLSRNNTETREGFDEINSLREEVGNHVKTGKLQQAASQFVEFWNGLQGWSTLPDAVKALLIQWVQYSPAEFGACLDHDTPTDRYAELSMPVLIMHGQQTRSCANAVVDVLVNTLSNCEVKQIQGAGHMGPITHATEVTHHVENFILGVVDIHTEQFNRKAA